MYRAAVETMKQSSDYDIVELMRMVAETIPHQEGVNANVEKRLESFFNAHHNLQLAVLGLSIVVVFQFAFLCLVIAYIH